jgi:M3 family oligoendopeptidase
MTLPKFEEMTAERPSIEKARASHAAHVSAFRESATRAARASAVRSWNEDRAESGTFGSMARLRFEQDTRNEQYKRDREYFDELAPKLTELETDFTNMLLDSEHRAEIAAEFGDHAFRLWELNRRSFDPVIEEDLVRESKLEAEYVELLASARLAFSGDSHNLSTIRKFYEEPDRSTRKSSQAVTWQFFEDHRATLDRIYDELTRLRTSMARKLGFGTYTDLGYLKMHRCGYGRRDVERFRDEVRTAIVPLAAALREQQRRELDVPELLYWDEAIHDREGNPTPRGGHDWMLERAQSMFGAMGDALGQFFSMMQARHLLDLKARDGKAGGGFCTGFPSYGVPFIFANFNGTKGDVEVFTHECGHAFQHFRSARKPLLEYTWPTHELAEVHSMGLEFLTWPHMESFFGADAARFRRIHLTQDLLFLPYGVAVDHFQHLVYDEPDAAPAARHTLWQRMEREYLPHRRYGDLPHVGAGGMWQMQRHIYVYPFYYVDYALALTCALQLWALAEDDRTAAMAAYHRLCAAGGERPFVETITSVGLRSPFEPGCLTDVAWKAREFLGL